MARYVIEMSAASRGRLGTAESCDSCKGKVLIVFLPLIGDSAARLIPYKAALVGDLVS